MLYFFRVSIFPVLCLYAQLFILYALWHATLFTHCHPGLQMNEMPGFCGPSTSKAVEKAETKANKQHSNPARASFVNVSIHWAFRFILSQRTPGYLLLLWERHNQWQTSNFLLNLPYGRLSTRHAIYCLGWYIFFMKLSIFQPLSPTNMSNHTGSAVLSPSGGIKLMDTLLRDTPEMEPQLQGTTITTFFYWVTFSYEQDAQITFSLVETRKKIAQIINKTI